MFYLKFQEMCERRNVSPSRALEEAGVNRSAFTYWRHKYEAGEFPTPTHSVLEKLCDYFGCTEAELLGIEKESSPAHLSKAEKEAIIDGMTKEELLEFTKLAMERIAEL